MKKTAYFIAISMILAACGSPTDLETKKKELAAKKDELRKLTSEISALEIEVAKLDTSAREHFIPVSVSPLERATYKNPVKIQGLVESDQNVTVSAELGGKVMKIHVIEGQKVRKGQLIASIDGSTAAGQVGELEAALELARINFEKQERLWKQNIGSEIQYLQSKNQVERLQNSLASARSQLGKFTLTSPINGTVDRIFANEGEYLAPGMSAVARIVNTEDIKIHANVSERYLGKFSIGDEVSITYPGIDKSHEATISALGNYINPDNRTFGMTIYPKGMNNDLKPNLLAIITAYDYRKDSVIAVPTKLIRNDGNGDYVLTVRKDAAGIPRVVKTSVTVEKSFISSSIIKEGLSEGDLLITEGYDTVIGGDAVKIIE